MPTDVSLNPKRELKHSFIDTQHDSAVAKASGLLARARSVWRRLAATLPKAPRNERPSELQPLLSDAERTQYTSPVDPGRQPAKLADLSDAELSELAASLARRTVAAEVADRGARLLSRFESTGYAFLYKHIHVEALDASNLTALARDLHDAGDALNTLQSYCDARGESLPAAARGLSSRMGDQLQAVLLAGQPDFGALSTQELDHFIDILKQFGVAPPRKLLLRATANRLPALEADYLSAVDTFAQGAIADSPEGMLRGLTEMESSFSKLRNTRRAIRHDLKSTEDTLDLRERLTANALARLGDAEAMAVFNTLHGLSGRTLLEGIYFASTAAIDARRESLGRSLNTMGIYLTEATDQIADELDARAVRMGWGSTIPRDANNRVLQPSSNEQVSANQLSSRARRAFRKILNIRSATSGNLDFRF
jgi:hypothetical protein